MNLPQATPSIAELLDRIEQLELRSEERIASIEEQFGERFQLIEERIPIPSGRNCGNSLRDDHKRIEQGEYLSSGNGYYLVLQHDHNLVLYKTLHWVKGNAVWESGTAGKGEGNCYLSLQRDNNLGSSGSLWHSRTYNRGEARRAHAILQRDGNFVVYDELNVLWQSQTAMHD